MTRSVQFNIRTDPAVADAVRERAKERGCSLGTALAELVQAGRAWSGEGLVVRPDPTLRRALAAVAASKGQTPEQVLDAAVRGEVRRQLVALAATLPEPEPPGPARPEVRGPDVLGPDGEDEPGDEVGLFTVFD